MYLRSMFCCVVVGWRIDLSLFGSQFRCDEASILHGVRLLPSAQVESTVYPAFAGVTQTHQVVCILCLQ